MSGSMNDIFQCETARAVLLQCPLVMDALCTDAVTLGQKTVSSLVLTVDLGPWFHKHNACLSCARGSERHRGVGVLTLHYQVASDSPGGATLNSKMSEFGYYRHVQYVCKKSDNFLL